MLPRTPAPYRTRIYALPTAPLRAAKRVETPDGALLATFVYGPDDADLADLPADGAVMVLHGNGGTHATYTAVIEELCMRGLWVIAFDARAQGQSTRGTSPLTYELLAEDAICVLDSLGVSRAHVLGHSDGGIEALLLARDHADRILSIVAGGANLTPDGVVDDPAWDTAGSAAANLAWSAFMEQGVLPATIDPTLLPSAEETRLSGELLSLMLEEPHIDAASLSAISCPVTVMVGEFDCIRDDETVAIARAIPQAMLMVVPGCGHSIPRQRPDAVIWALLGQLDLQQ